MLGGLNDKHLLAGSNGIMGQEVKQKFMDHPMRWAACWNVAEKRKTAGVGNCEVAVKKGLIDIDIHSRWFGY